MTEKMPVIIINLSINCWKKSRYARWKIPLWGHTFPSSITEAYLQCTPSVLCHVSHLKKKGKKRRKKLRHHQISKFWTKGMHNQGPHENTILLIKKSVWIHLHFLKGVLSFNLPTDWFALMTAIMTWIEVWKSLQI